MFTKSTPLMKAAESAAAAGRGRVEARVRSTVGKWFGPLQGLDAEWRKQEQAEREVWVESILRLYVGSCVKASGGTCRELRDEEIVAALTTIRRVTQIYNVGVAEICAYCCLQLESDKYDDAHQVDPLQLRHVYTFHRAYSDAQFAELDTQGLWQACLKSEQASVRAWFGRLIAKRETLPRDICPFLRHVLYYFWNEGVGDRETLAFELAVFDVQMNDALGWETSRAFVALLERIAGVKQPVFAVYMNDEDMDEALMVHQALDQQDQTAYFRTMLGGYNTKLLKELERLVYAHVEKRALAAAQAAAEEAAAAAEQAKKTGRFRRFLG